MTKAFDAVIETMATHLASQKKRAMSPESSKCMYRIDGLQCAVGCLIPDELYHPSIEMGVTRIFTESDNPKLNAVSRHLKGLVPSVHEAVLLRFLESCQQYHDSNIYYSEEEKFSYANDVATTPDDNLKDVIKARLQCIARNSLDYEVSLAGTINCFAGKKK